MKPYLYSPIRSLVLEGTSPGNPPLWFIPSLLVVQCLYAYLHSKQIRKYQCALIGLLGGLLLMAINYKFVPAYIGSGMMGLFYYSMGKILHTYEGKWKVVLGCVLLCITLLLLDSIPNADVRHIAQYKGNVWDLLHGAATATCGCFIINSLIKYIQPILKFPILRFIGIHAMEFYVIHWIVLLIIARLIMGDLLHIYDEQLQFLISGLGCALLIPIFIFFKNKWLSQKTY